MVFVVGGGKEAKVEGKERLRPARNEPSHATPPRSRSAAMAQGRCEQSAPMVATGWGVFFYKEFQGAPNGAWLSLVAMVALYAGACALIALSKS